MKAARIHEYGPPSVFRIEDVPDPEPGRDDVLIEVHASSVNPVDCKIRRGGQRGAIRYRLPWILGLDLSGEVLAVGDRVTRFAVGDQVWASPTHRRPGCYAERIVVKEKELGKKPESLSHTEAASLPLVALTAHQCLEAAGVAEGHRVLIQAGSGGVGSVAIQLAKRRGAHVITTCSARNADYVRELGADEVIDYREVDWREAVADLDMVLDALGVAERRQALSVVKKGGAVVSITAGLPGYTKRYGPLGGLVATGWAMLGYKLAGLFRGKRALAVLKRCRGDQLDELAALVDDGALRPHVSEIFPLEAIADAHTKSETGRVRGKLAIAIAGR